MDEFYRKKLPDKVFWDNEPAPFLHEILKRINISKGAALDLGTGTGKKACLLARQGFEVTAIDISSAAIVHARSQARKNKVDIKFISHDVTDLFMFNDESFDLILDWACLHHIPENKHQVYVSEVKRVCKKRGFLILRCFSKHKISSGEIGFITRFGPVYLFSIEDIKKLYGDDFKIIEHQRSKRKRNSYRYFEELLMMKK